MSDEADARDSYPLAERRSSEIVSETGKRLDAVTMDAVVEGGCGVADLRISADTLRRQADVARAAARGALAENLERAAEMTGLSQDEVLGIYELLRPGRCRSKEELLRAARRLRDDHGAPKLADLLDSAAEVYERRGLFAKRF